MATSFPTFNNRQQNQQTTLTPLNRNNQRQRENSEDQNNWTNNMDFLAMAGNLAGNLDWKTLLGMAFGFGLTGMLPKLFDRDKKQATGPDSMNEYLIKQDDGLINDKGVGVLPIATDKPEIAIPDEAGTSKVGGVPMGFGLLRDFGKDEDVQKLLMQLRGGR